MNYIIWKDENSNNFEGLIISELPPISKPQMRTSITEIDGRDGDIVEFLGYKSYTKTVSIVLTTSDNINEIIKYFTGSGKLVLSNEPDKYYNAQIINSIDYDRLIKYKTANVKFYVQPYKFALNETSVDETINDQTSITVQNIGLETSNPILHLYGTGELHFYLNDTEIFKYTFDDDGEVIIDSEQQEAYLDTVLKNSNMLGDFPSLIVGENIITWTGTLTRIIIEPKSRWI